MARPKSRAEMEQIEAEEPWDYAAPEGPRRDGQLAIPDELTSVDEQAYTAVQLQLKGHDLETIAEQTGYANARSAEVAMRAYLQRTGMMLDASKREEILELSRRRVEHLMRPQWLLAEEGDTKAAEFCLRAIMGIAKLYGADELHQKVASSTRTLILAGTPEENAALLKAHIEEN